MSMAGRCSRWIRELPSRVPPPRESSDTLWRTMMMTTITGIIGADGITAGVIMAGITVATGGGIKIHPIPDE